VDRTLKLKDGEGVTVTVNVPVLLSVPLVPVTTTGKVPLVVMSVDTVRVAVPEVLTEPGETVQVRPALGVHPDVTVRLTLPVNPPPAVIVKVVEAVPPAPML
jgi:hypothetical protein